MERAELVAGIFVGGESSRMGGQAKGLLTLKDGRTLLERWVEVLEALGAEVVLVGRREDYAFVALPQLEDAPSGSGPIGGLAALLMHAGERPALAVACDMPFVELEDLRALLDARGDAPAAAPRRDDRWEPMCAVYDAPAALPVVRARIEAGRRSLFGVLDALEARAVSLPARHLEDWDQPEDRARSIES